MRFGFAILFLVCFNCKMKQYQDIEDCSNVKDYYEKGIHYIDRNLVTDDNTIDLKKLFERTEQTRSECYPANHEIK